MVAFRFLMKRRHENFRRQWYLLMIFFCFVIGAIIVAALDKNEYDKINQDKFTQEICDSTKCYCFDNPNCICESIYLGKDKCIGTLAPGNPFQCRFSYKQYQELCLTKEIKRGKQ